MFISLIFLFQAFFVITGQNIRNTIQSDVLQNFDTIGTIVNIAERILSRATFQNFGRKERFCTTHLMKFSDTEVKVSGQPRGTCPYCCPIIHPKKYVKLYFTNKYLKGNIIELNLNNRAGSLQRVGFKNNIPTVIFIHGFTEHGLGPLPIKIRNAYLSRPEDYNIILVDWGELTPLPWYPHAAKNARVAAKVVADFISYYSDTGELPISNIHLIGFSLGAHVAGFIGKNLQVKEKVPRITALDPARPLFAVDDDNQRVSKNDAKFVDVIHTDGGKFGIPISIGHADFYPNGGTYIQPGCSTSFLAENRTIEHFGACSHLRAVELYAESVTNSGAFPVFKCRTRCKRYRNAYMGFGANRESAVGDLYLVTNNRPPFGIQHQI